VGVADGTVAVEVLDVSQAPRGAPGTLLDHRRNALHGIVWVVRNRTKVALHEATVLVGVSRARNVDVASGLLDNCSQNKTRIDLGCNTDLNDSIMNCLLVGSTVFCLVDRVLQVESPHIVEVDPLIDPGEVRRSAAEAFVGVRWLDTLSTSRKVRLVPAKCNRVGNDLGSCEMANEAAGSVAGRGGDCSVGGWQWVD